jgi:acetyl-CoA C-acetyltransferase
MHAIATMMDRLRAAPNTKGLVTGLGWYLTKHSVGIYSATPKDDAWVRPDLAAVQADLDSAPHPALTTEPRGAGTIETYTVLHDRDGQPMKGIVVGRLGDGERFLANTPDDRAVLDGLVAREGIGRRGSVSSADGNNTFKPD